MKVVSKFLAAFLLVSTLCLTIYAFWSAEREARSGQASVVSDLAALAYGLREGMLATWSHAGEEAALGIVWSVQEQRPDLKISWTQVEASGVRTYEQDSALGRRLAIAIPVNFAGTRGTLDVSRLVPSKATILRERLLEEMAVVGVMVLGAGFIAVVLGLAVIGRPLERVVAQARRIGEGDFSKRLKSTGTDEIGILKRELNAMCDQLMAAQTKLEAESAARVEMHEQLRHLDRLRTVGTLASSLAHELGTPLNVLLLRGQSLAQGEADDKEAEEAGQVVVAQVDKMSRIVRQILDFARREDAVRTSFELGEVARRTANLLSSLAKKHSVHIGVHAIAPGVVMGHQEQIEQAVTNLVINGIQAMPRGGELRIQVREREDTPPHASRSVPVSTIEVVDHGTGMSADQLSRIFEPFYTTKPPGVGTGLGLSVVSGIAAEHGGWVTAESREGEGSTFAIHFPRSA